MPKIRRKRKTRPVKETDYDSSSSKNERPLENNQEERQTNSALSDFFKTLKIFVLFLLFLMLLGFLVPLLYSLLPKRAQEPEPVVDESNVLILTDANFDRAVGDNPRMLVQFHFTWSERCKSIKPRWPIISLKTTLRTSPSRKSTPARTVTRRKSICKIIWVMTIRA